MRKLGIDYRHAELSHLGESFKLERIWHPTIDAWSPIYNNIKEAFNFHKFTAPHLPIDMGRLNVAPFKAVPRILRTPIKWSNSLEVRLPKELLPIAEEVRRVLQYDYWIMGELFEKFFVHLTVDNSVVKAGTSQRFPGFHGDGLQGGQFKQKLICEHSYVMTDVNPTRVAIQPFFVAHLNEDRVNIFKEFDRQVDEAKLYRLREEHLYLIDPYIVHDSPICDEETERTFVRITVTPMELLTPHNTINPMFDGQDYPDKMEVREFVSDPDEEIPHSFYGLKKD